MVSSRKICRRKLPLFKMFTYFILIIITVFFLFPIYWMIVTSFKPPTEITVKIPVLIPKNPTLKPYEYVFTLTDFVRQFFNSIIVALGTTAAGAMVGTFSGYALSRFTFKGKKIFSMYLLAIYMIPGVFLLLPLYLILKSLFLTNTHLGLILTHLTFALPFSIWMMKGYFDSLPVDMEESALVDGCSRVGAVVRIAMPLAAPGVAATALYCFVLSWQEYLFAVTIMASEEMRTLPVGVAAFMSWATLEWGPIMAFVTLMTIPTMIFFAYLQKFLIQGLTAGAIKG